MPTDRQLLYRLLAAIDGFIYEFRSTYKIVGAFLVSFSTIILGSPLSEERAKSLLRESGIRSSSLAPGTSYRPCSTTRNAWASRVMTGFPCQPVKATGAWVLYPSTRSPPLAIAYASRPIGSEWNERERAGGPSRTRSSTDGSTNCGTFTGCSSGAVTGEGRLRDSAICADGGDRSGKRSTLLLDGCCSCCSTCCPKNPPAEPTIGRPRESGADIRTGERRARGTACGPP